MRPRLGSLLPLVLSVAVAAVPASGEDPLIAARAFCSADGAGDRLSPYEWQELAPLLAWQLEPAWDRLVLIRGYEISTPRRAADRIEVDVTYTVVGEVTPGVDEAAGDDGGDGETGGDDKERLESVTLTLVADGAGGWRIGGAPPPPHVFENLVDADRLADLLQPDTGYESSSALVWKRLRAAGWDIPYTSAAAIPASPHFREVGTAEPGDVALYFAHGAPYHAGMVGSGDQVLSATLNAGPVVAPFAAFPGAIRYWRPVRPDEDPGNTADPAVTPSPAPLRRP